MNQRVEEQKRLLELERLKRAEEQAAAEERERLFAVERATFLAEKIKLEEASKRLNQSSYGQEKLIDQEVDRRLKLKLAEAEKTEAGEDDDKALQAFIQFRDAYTIDYKRINDDDVLVDAMSEADSLDLKKILMRYRRLKNEAIMRDPNFSNRILRNYFSCIRKVGLLVKRQERSLFGKWDTRFMVLTNAGFIYFKSEKLLSEDDLQPQTFKPLNDFVVTTVPSSVSVWRDLTFCRRSADARTSSE